MEAQIYRECLRYYPFVLGAEPVRPVDLAAFYASIANEGLRPAPHVVESIERNGVVVYRHDPRSAVAIKSVDRAAFYQLKTMLQGVLARGTAQVIAGLSPYVAGKTGTSDDENDAWFVGFTNDVTVAVWIGYDNAEGKRRTLGGGSTGGHVAVPIFEPVIQAVWAHAAPKAALAPPSPEAKRQLACQSIDLESGEARSGRGKAFSECFRVDRKGRVIDTQYRLMSREKATYAKRDPEDGAARKKEASVARKKEANVARKKEASADRSGSARAPNSDNAWSRQPWGAQQQWGWQSGSGQQWRDDRREWRSTQPTWGSWR